MTFNTLNELSSQKNMKTSNRVFKQRISPKKPQYEPELAFYIYTYGYSVKEAITDMYPIILK
jgi:hypothetical protein